jgi:septal ring factor EnvC (AmiA/AmiB activator)
MKELIISLHQKQDKQSEEITGIRIEQGKFETLLAGHIKQDEIMASEIAKNNEKLAEYNSQLAVHIAGVTQLKEQNKLIREEMAQRDVLIGQALAPLTVAKHIGKWASWLGGFVTLAAGILKLLGKI